MSTRSTKRKRDAYNNLSRRRKNMEKKGHQQIIVVPKHWCPITRETMELESGSDCPHCFAVVP